MHWVIIIWVIIPVFVGFAVWANHKREQQRRAEIEQLASGLGLESHEHLPSSDTSHFHQFDLASKGRNGRVSNVIVADSGELRMVIFDFEFVTGSGKSKTTHRQTVVQIQNADLVLPSFSIGPESFMHRLGNFLGFDDIDFTEDQAFSDQFLLYGDDADAVRLFFNPDRRQAFMKHSNVSVEARPSCFIFYQQRKRYDANEIKALMSEAFELHSILNA